MHGDRPALGIQRNPFDTPRLRAVLKDDIEQKLLEYLAPVTPVDAGDEFRDGIENIAGFMAAYICDGMALRAVSVK